MNKEEIIKALYILYDESRNLQLDSEFTVLFNIDILADKFGVTEEFNKFLDQEEDDEDDEDIERIFNEYSLDYRDRGVVGYVFEDTNNLGYEEAESMGYINSNDSIFSKYFDYEQFGEDLLEEDRYVELADGRVASLMY